MEQNNEKNNSFNNAPAPVPANMLSSYIKTHETTKLMAIMQEIRKKLDEFLENKIPNAKNLKQREYLMMLSNRRQKILTEMRQLIGNLEVIWVEQTAGYKGSKKNLILAANIIIARFNIIAGTADVSKQSSVNLVYDYLNQLLPRMQTIIIFTSGDHLSKTEKMNYELESIRVHGFAGMAAKAGIVQQNTGLIKRTLRRFRKK